MFGVSEFQIAAIVFIVGFITVLATLLMILGGDRYWKKRGGA